MFAGQSLDMKNVKYKKQIDENAKMIMLYQSFVQWQHRFNEDLSLYTGLNGQFFQYNNSWSVDPRASIKYQITENQSVKIGYGFHSQLQPMMVYITRSDSAPHRLNNKNLGFTKSHQFVVGYDILLAKDLRFKTEAYYQYLFDIPVIEINQFLVDHKDDPQYSEAFYKKATVSLSNYGAEFYNQRYDSLVNKGTGRNYGVEFTLEKFFSHGFYSLATVSLFQSKYKTPHIDKELNTVFNNNVICNMLGGYEFKISKKRSLGIDLKGTFSGGRRKVDIDFEKSKAAREAVYVYNNVYEKKYRPYFRLDVKFSMKSNAKWFSEVFSVDLQNITNNNNMMMEAFSYNQKNPNESKIVEIPQMKFFVMPTYRITF
jgi:hypothetical protein